MSNASAYDSLVSSFTRLYRYQHLSAMASWDQAAMMPSKGNDARSAALAELAVLMHNVMTEPSMPQQLEQAKKQAKAPVEQASLREMERQWKLTNLLPSDLVEAMSLANSHCEHAWRKQRPANDWSGFLANFKPVVKLARQEARILADAFGTTPCDALVAKYEPGMSTVVIEKLFSELKTWLPGLIQEVLAKQAKQTVVAAKGPFPIDKQRALGLEIMKLLEFDFDAGRLDISIHPFCGGVAEDVRITTRYREDDFMQSVMGIVHETGHARYEQGLPRDLVHLPVGQARSMGVHESQSLSYEMQIGRGSAFLALIAPLLKKHLGDDPAFELANLITMYTRVRRGFIRVDADELTYPAHIILRFEIERDLMNGIIEAEDIPSLWNEKMHAYLGLETKGNYDQGCLQDIHWPGGSFGYFPSYTLGAIYAAQYFAAIRAEYPNVDQSIAAGNLSPVFSWLQKNIWSQASLWPTDQLIAKATGQELSAVPFEKHLRARYLG